MYKKTILIFVLVFFISGLTLSEQNGQKKSKGIPVAEFLPGIHQIKNRKLIKGCLLLGTFLTAIAGAVIENNRGNDFYDQYLNSVVVEDIVEFRKKAENSYRLRNYFMAGILAVWVIHLLDMKFFKKKGGIKGEIKNNSIHFGLYFSF